MYVEPWILWLILAPIAAVMAVYVGYLRLLLVGVLSITIGLGLSMAGDGLCPFVNWLAACSTRDLGYLVRPFRHVWPLAGLCRDGRTCSSRWLSALSCGLPLNPYSVLPLLAPCVTPAADVWACPLLLRASLLFSPR